jgi:hypothetical protein
MALDNILGSYSVIWNSDFNPFSPQDISKHNLNNQKNTSAISGSFEKRVK